MKVLWFTNIPSLAGELLGVNVNIGGWIPVLEKNLKQKTEIEIAIAFHWNVKKIEKMNGVNRYYLIPRAGNYTQKVFRKLFNRIDPIIEVQYYKEVIEDYKPDIIHIFGTENAFGLITMYTDLPVVIWIQGNISSYIYKWYNSGISYLDILKYSGLQELLLKNDFNSEYNRMSRIAFREKEIFKNCKYYIGRTDWDKRVSMALSPSRKYYHCDDMIRSDFFNKQWETNNSKNNSAVIVSIIGRNIYKGLPTIVETINIFKNTFNDNIKWKIIGFNSSDRIVRLLKRKFRNLKVWENIKFLGELSPTKIIEEMQNSDIFVHPSHIENAPNSLDEAMLLGMPIITTYAGGTPCLIENNKEGILVQDGDPFVLAGAIRELYKNKKYSIQIGKNARIRALKRHDPDKIISDMVNIYKDILSNKNNGKK